MISSQTMSVLISIFVGLVVMVIYHAVRSFMDHSTEIEELKLKSKDKSGVSFFLNITPQTFLFLRVTLSVVMFFATAFSVHIIFGIVCAFLGFMLPVFFLGRAKRKRLDKLESQLVEALELLSNGVKSGLTLAQSMELVVNEFPPPISQEFSTLLAETRVGVDFIDALFNMAHRTESNIIQILATGVAITKRCGGDLTQIFQNIANTIRERSFIEGKLRAVTAQGRAQGVFLGLMPFGLIIIMSFIDPSHVETLFGNQIGVWAFVAVVVMVGLAQLWIKKLISIDV